MNVELLAPAGNVESMKAAYAAGADAVYIGGSRFGARAFADNPEADELINAIEYAHLKGKKLYLTVNTLLKDREMDELYAYLLPYYRHGLDAAIVQDVGVFCKLREWFPDLELHVSTQMTITGADGAKLLKEMGASRIVTARELSLAEIKEIHDAVNIEIESFVHGALCYCYSGQCLLSSMIGGRSGNRGRCAQPCRLPYEWVGEQKKRKDKYLLSPKDLCTLDLIPDLIENGVYSFKIEGRMKRPEYTAGVTRIYRKYIDRYLTSQQIKWKVDEEDRVELMDLYNRGGFTDGYYRQHNGPQMMASSRPNHQGTAAAKVLGSKNGRIQMRALLKVQEGDVLEAGGDGGLEFTIKESVKTQNTFSVAAKAKRPNLAPGTIVFRTHNAFLLQELKKMYLDTPIPEKINGKLILSKGKPAILTVIHGTHQVYVQGTVPSAAVNRPLLLADVEKQIRKTGGSGFAFNCLDIIMEDDLFLPMQALNELRRNALEALKKQIIEQYYRTADREISDIGRAAVEKPEKAHPALAVSLECLDGFEAVCNAPNVERIYIDCTAFAGREKFLALSGRLIQSCHEKKKQCFYILPWIFRAQARKYYQAEAFVVLEQYDGVLVRSLDELQFLKEQKYVKTMAADWNLYTFNRAAADFFRKEGLAFDTVSPELNKWELKERSLTGSELIVYGYQPLMVSAQCQVKNRQGCTNKPSVHYLMDRKNMKFAVKNQCAFCYNTIYNSAVLELSDCKEEILKLHPQSIRLQFTVETDEETAQVLRRYEAAFFGEGGAVVCPQGAYTRGHFTRKVE